MTNDNAKTSTRPVLVTGVRLIDGSGNPPQDDAAVLIEDGLVKQVGRSADFGTNHDIQVIDGAGRTLLPGLMDLHNHSIYQSEMPVYVKHGITTMRFAGVRQEDVVALRKAVRGGLAGPRIYSCGPMLDAGAPQFSEWTRTIEHPAAARAVAEDLFAQDGIDRVDALIALHRTTPELLRALVEVAKEHGRPVVGQFDHTDAVEAAEVGITQLENTSRIFVSRDYPKDRLLDYAHDSASERLSIFFKAWTTVDWDRTAPMMDAMIRHGVRYCPTLIVIQHMAGQVQARIERSPDYAAFGDVEKAAHDKLWNHIEQLFTDEDRRNAAAAAELMSEWMSRFHRRGGRLLPGTDMQYGGIVLHDELENFAAAGLSTVEVIKAATGDSAEALGVSDELGTVEVGKVADLVIVDGDPGDDLSTLRRPRFVLQRGAVTCVDGVVA